MFVLKLNKDFFHLVFEVVDRGSEVARSRYNLVEMISFHLVPDRQTDRYFIDRKEKSYLS